MYARSSRRCSAALPQIFTFTQAVRQPLSMLPHQILVVASIFGGRAAAGFARLVFHRQLVNRLKSFFNPGQCLHQRVDQFTIFELLTGQCQTLAMDNRIQVEQGLFSRPRN